MGVSGGGPCLPPGVGVSCVGFSGPTAPKKVAQDWHLSCSKPDMNHRQPHKVCVWRGYTRGALQFKPMGPTGALHTNPSQPQLLPL